jgi:hypothetical protein
MSLNEFPPESRPHATASLERISAAVVAHEIYHVVHTHALMPTVVFVSARSRAPLIHSTPPCTRPQIFFSWEIWIHTIKRSPLWIHTITISLTYGVHGIYLKFGSFNGIDPIVPFFFDEEDKIAASFHAFPRSCQETTPEELSFFAHLADP